MIAVIAIDVQNDFATGTLGNPAVVQAMPLVREIVHWGVENHQLVIATRDTHDADYLSTQEGKNLPIPHTQYGTWGWEIVEGVIPENGKDHVILIDKGQFGYPNWDLLPLENCNEIVVIGFLSDICAISNILIIKALFPEIPVTFIHDASAGLTPESHEAACQVMKSCQVNVMSWEEYKERDNANAY